MSIVPTSVSSPNDELGVPTEFAISQNYPNPFNPTTTITYQLPQSGQVHLAVYNISGQLVEMLVSMHKNAGYHSVIWKATGMPTGLYFCTLKANGFTVTRKIVLVK